LISKLIYSQLESKKYIYNYLTGCSRASWFISTFLAIGKLSSVDNAEGYGYREGIIIGIHYSKIFEK
jgi:hypothetical protein